MWPDMMTAWDAGPAPDRCTCTRIDARHFTLADTLTCPNLWRETPGGWEHVWPARQQQRTGTR